MRIVPVLLGVFALLLFGAIMVQSEGRPTYVAYFNTTDTLVGDQNFTWNFTSQQLRIQGAAFVNNSPICTQSNGLCVSTYTNATAQATTGWAANMTTTSTSLNIIAGSNVIVMGNVTLNGDFVTTNRTRVNFTGTNGSTTGPGSMNSILYTDQNSQVHVGTRNPATGSPNCNSYSYRFYLDGQYCPTNSSCSDRSAFMQVEPVNNCVNGEEQLCFYANGGTKIFCIGAPGATVFQNGIQTANSGALLASGNTIRGTDGANVLIRGEFNYVQLQGEKNTANDYDIRLLGKNAFGGGTASNLVGFYNDANVKSAITKDGYLHMARCNGNYTEGDLCYNMTAHKPCTYNSTDLVSLYGGGVCA